MAGITNEYVFPLFLFLPVRLSVCPPLNLLSSSSRLMHHIPLAHCRPLRLSEYLSSSFFLCFSPYKAASVEKRPFSLLGLCGATVVNCVFTVAPISCHQAWKNGYRGDLRAHTAIWKAFLVKELETIMVSVKCSEIWPVSEHKSFDLQRVVTLVVLSKVRTGDPIGQCRFLQGLHLTARSNIFLFFICSHIPSPVLPDPPKLRRYYEKLPHLSMKHFMTISPLFSTAWIYLCYFTD